MIERQSNEIDGKTVKIAVAMKCAPPTPTTSRTDSIINCRFHSPSSSSSDLMRLLPIGEVKMSLRLLTPMWTGCDNEEYDTITRPAESSAHISNGKLIYFISDTSKKSNATMNCGHSRVTEETVVGLCYVAWYPCWPIDGHPTRPFMLPLNKQIWHNRMTPGPHKYTYHFCLCPHPCLFDFNEISIRHRWTIYFQTQTGNEQ